MMGGGGFMHSVRLIMNDRARRRDQVTPGNGRWSEADLTNPKFPPRAAACGRARGFLSYARSVCVSYALF